MISQRRGLEGGREGGERMGQDGWNIGWIERGGDKMGRRADWAWERVVASGTRMGLVKF